MKILEKKKKEIDIKDFIKRSAVRDDFSELITEPTILTEDGVIKAVYDRVDWNTEDIKWALPRLKYEKGKRLRGLASSSRIFGYRPRNTIRQDYCSTTSLAREFPKEHAIICSHAKNIEEVYFNRYPEKYESHKKMADERTLADWRIHGTVFTSGIINKDNQLKYHFDTGNFKDVFSAMLSFKYGIEGGFLSLPEYDLGFEVADDTILLFDGQGILHGVTPIQKVKPKAYRYTLVFYSLKDIWNCLTIDEEVVRIRQKKTEREFRRHNMPDDHRKSLEARFGKQ